MGAINGFLLDTHTLLWSVQEDHKLSPRARAIIEPLDSKLFVSAISAFEIGNKFRIGKLPEYRYVVENYHEIVRKLGVFELPLHSAHAFFASRIEWNHRDPFDRILAAQAASENLTLITNDARFSELPWLSTLW
ncbi:twitching motility protein PilT [Betaproteobacteria bacterium]|nr:twitching motility protein PilT [Betaproteobacteria bacterium]GHU13303.1 twitching motility protein PilT [Betaproteobacteria bacterium]